MGLTLIKSLTASSSSSLDFVDGTSDVVFDNTYNEYQFYFVNMHPETSSTSLQFQVNATDGADFNDSPIQSTFFEAYHSESGAASALSYSNGRDAANSTSDVDLLGGVHNAVDASVSGILTLYAPSSTTYVKHWMCRSSLMSDTPANFQTFTAGYINDTTAIDEIRFKMSSGNIDEGTIYMYGVS